MDALYWLGGLVTAALFVYLLVALVPEQRVGQPAELPVSVAGQMIRHRF